MTVISLEHVKPQIKGYLTRFMYEIRAGVFVGTISSRTREMLIKDIKENDPDVDMVVAYRFKGKTYFESYGYPTRAVVDFEGVQLLSRILEKEHASYEIVLGKPHKTLLSHSFDTAYACCYLAEKTVYKVQFEKLAENRGVTVKEIKDYLSFICAVHDIGKLHPFFQAKLFFDDNRAKTIIEEVYGDLVSGYEGYRHEYGSEEILKKFLKTENIERKDRNIIGAMVRMHHQGAFKGYKYINERASINELPLKWEKELVEPFYNNIKKELCVSFDSISRITNNMPIWVFTIMLGIIMTCDWIASGERFLGIDIINYRSLKEYRDRIYEILDQMNVETGLGFKEFDKKYSYKDLFDIKTTRSMQETVKQVLEEHPYFDCLLIEAPTGEGKSEAALYAALNTMSNRGLQGMYFALPTGLTSEAMYPRIEKMLKKIGEDTLLRLSTGTAWLSDLNDNVFYQDMIFRKFKLLDRFCVGTVDQIMTAATLAYYMEIKMSAMGSKVVVIDEVHSYDAYMMAIMDMMLKYFKQMGTPVIMLSATLSDKARKKILSYYQIEENEFSDSYPKVCLIEDNRLYQCDCKPSNRQKAITCSVTNGEPQDFLTSASDKVKSGGCLAFIVNSVDSAISLYLQMRDLLKDRNQDTQLYLIHARLPITKKEEKTHELEILFGKNRSSRPYSAIVFATPIIEMSMDLDFDFMYRQIAPIDAILQSMGRVARHDDEGTVRINGILPEIIIMKSKSGNSIYAGINNRKDEPIPLLEITANVLSQYNKIKIPIDVNKLINSVYDSTALKSYYADEEIQKMSGSLNIGHYDPSIYISPGNIAEESKERRSYIPTRENAIEYIKVAIMDEKMLETAKTGSFTEIRQLYKDTVVSVPSWKIKDIESDYMRINDKLSCYFNDVDVFQQV